MIKIRSRERGKRLDVFFIVILHELIIIDASIIFFALSAGKEWLPPASDPGLLVFAEVLRKDTPAGQVTACLLSGLWSRSSSTLMRNHLSFRCRTLWGCVIYFGGLQKEESVRGIFKY
jgi:hypothetical protein